MRAMPYKEFWGVTKTRVHPTGSLGGVEAIVLTVWLDTSIDVTAEKSVIILLGGCLATYLPAL